MLLSELIMAEIIINLQLLRIFLQEIVNDIQLSAY